MAAAAQEDGVTYISGDAGYVQQLVYDETGKCIGALTKDGRSHLADIVILSTGANTAALIDAKDEIIAKSLCLGVVALTPAEAEKYKDIPIVDNFEQGRLPSPLHSSEVFLHWSVGCLFPPDEHGMLKILGARVITNYANSRVPGASLGHSHEDFPEDGVPSQIEAETREFVRGILPELADRPWVFTRMCW
jgi:sarcosine oxidase/L-pipecolate oxidase